MPKQICTTVPRQECTIVPREECKNVPKLVSKQVSKQEEEQELLLFASVGAAGTLLIIAIGIFIFCRKRF